ncbi:MAG: type IIA DNA topoisomerase subunit B [Bacteroidetes bacterium]|jgi:topoisomerase-4 subunit B|nr:type IIA DNA topoisomerase subunit B [Bacteroidota bacterium]MBT5529615.1 type IIA DNA topoisomerase subunit B [Cytophagia bacterium]MBT3421320.1 type IIA DNA topoisomerase subunit B [Bacteroidota bacterium]MBT3800747.1 type IIA DNA topoisomerase subunit B [Bacteroidota bacterium]MBT4338773.1 type IIA DNA topoisomerase subunit B [Bacteroidota bacterium]
MSKTLYTEDSIRSLDWREHIRMRPGMYIGKQGDGSSRDDGIYILVKEIVDNSVDEYVMGYGKKIDITVEDNIVCIRDYGRGVPLGSVIDCVSRINTGGKYDSKVFKKAVGLNGVGAKAVNALSGKFKIESIRDKKCKIAEFEKGELIQDMDVADSTKVDGTIVTFTPDDEIFENYNYIPAYLNKLLWNYAYLNSGLTINYNGEKFFSANGLYDLLQNKTNVENLEYPIIHLKGEDIEVALSHGKQYGEEYYSFVNGQYTPQGGTHLLAFKEAIVKTIREFYKKTFDPSDIRASIISAVSIKVIEPVFESQTKTKLGSMHMEPDGQTIKSFVNDFIKKELDDYLHKNPDVADTLHRRIIQSEKERKAISGIKKLANERAKKANLHNKKLRDCKVHFTNSDHEKRYDTTLFITEGDSASGSITKSRDIDTQAVFSLRGKPLNTFGLKKNVVYENEEFNLLQHALNIENGIDELRYNRIVIATDADVDGMHIRLLLLTFFLQFFSDLVKDGHVYILETPLFRVRNKVKTYYCYSQEEKRQAMKKLGAKPEITRFKGLGEISPNEFGLFIGNKMKLEPVMLSDQEDIKNLLNYYMGKNTPERQEFIISNLKVEKDIVEEELK